MTEAHEQVRAMLYRVFRGSPTPLLTSEAFGIPGASLWSGARLWVQAFRDCGLEAGDRVAIGLPVCPAQVMSTIAAWWNGLTVCPAAPGGSSQILARTGARLVIARGPAAHTLVPAHDEEPGKPVAIGPTGVRSPETAVWFESEPRAQAPVSVGWGAIAQLSCVAGTPGLVAIGAMSYRSRIGLIDRLWAPLISGSEVRVEGEGQCGHIEPTRLRGSELTMWLS